MHDSAVERVLEIMDNINTVPRQSGNLEKIHQWVMNWGRQRNFQTETDEAMNVLIRVPPSPGYERAPTIVLQGHMDMVCEKRPDVDHDFQKDPIISWRDGDWLRAKGTSLGADNAIALALFFDLVTDPAAEHPALEILITSDEESGLVGAQKLRPGFLTGTVLLNLDSEDVGVFTVGCAGGMDTNLLFPVDREAVPNNYAVRKLEVGGLNGGHSGSEIHLDRANANVLLVRALRGMLNTIPEFRLGALNGGTTHNAIPREASATVAVPPAQLTDLEKRVAAMEVTMKSEFAAADAQLFLRLGSGADTGSMFSAAAGSRIIDALRLIPHGVKHHSSVFPGVVDTSMNFAVLRSDEKEVKVLTNRRSAVMSRGEDYSESLFGLARLYGGRYTTGNHYPAWEPQVESDVLERSRRLWNRLFDTEAEVEVTHAGLECGAIGARYPKMDMISFGPTIMQPHSPDERMHIPSVLQVRSFFHALLKSYKV